MSVEGLRPKLTKGSDNWSVLRGVCIGDTSHAPLTKSSLKRPPPLHTPPLLPTNLTVRLRGVKFSGHISMPMMQGKHSEIMAGQPNMNPMMRTSCGENEKEIFDARMIYGRDVYWRPESGGTRHYRDKSQIVLSSCFE